MSKQVTCIIKRGNHYDEHERIQAIGGIASGVRWQDKEEAAIANVKRDPQSYYTSAGGHSVWIVIAKHNGREYLKTKLTGMRPTICYRCVSAPDGALDGAATTPRRGASPF
jgi:hypothetical protein